MYNIAAQHTFRTFLHTIRADHACKTYVQSSSVEYAFSICVSEASGRWRRFTKLKGIYASSTLQMSYAFNNMPRRDV